MENIGEIRFEERFQNLDKSYKLLKKYANRQITTELERAGIIQFFEMTFELSWKVLQDYLEEEGYQVETPRQTIKQAFQIGLIDDERVWIDALLNRNLAPYTYDEELAEQITNEILNSYLPELEKMYNKLSK